MHSAAHFLLLISLILLNQHALSHVNYHTFPCNSPQNYICTCRYDIIPLSTATMRASHMILGSGLS